jgi:hypothetical protein
MKIFFCMTDLSSCQMNDRIMSDFMAALCELLHTMKNNLGGPQLGNSTRHPWPYGDELLERALVADGQAAAPQFNDACVSPDGELLTHELARDA